MQYVNLFGVVRCLSNKFWDLSSLLSKSNGKATSNP